MPMAKYQSPGTANLRVVSQTKMAPAPTLPSAGGTPVGGTDNLRAESRTLMAAPPSQPTGSGPAAIEGVSRRAGLSA